MQCAFTIVLHAEKANAQIGTFGFCHHIGQTQKTKRACFFANARTEKRNLEQTKRIEK